MLGHILEREEAEAQSAGDDRRLGRQKQKLRRGHERARRETFRDFGIQ